MVFGGRFKSDPQLLATYQTVVCSLNLLPPSLPPSLPQSHPIHFYHKPVPQVELKLLLFETTLQSG